MAEGMMKGVKYLLVFFNLLFFISGILVIAGGAVIMTALRQFIDSFGGMPIFLGTVVIIVGVIIFVISFFGCCGAFRENYCLIVTFSAFVALTLLVEVGCVVAGVVMKGRLKTVIEDHLMDDLTKYSDGSDAIVKVWDQRQIGWECCGVSNYTNWMEVTSLNASVPQSCCVEGHCNVTGLAAAPEDYALYLIYTSGCFEIMKEWAMSNIGIFLGVGIGLVILQIVGIILASCLACDVKKSIGFV